MKKMTLALLCVLTTVSITACGTPHNPDNTFGHLMKGTFYYEPESFDWHTFGGAFALIPLYRGEGSPEAVLTPNPFVETGREELNEEFGTLPIDFETYDPDRSYRLAEQIAAIPKIDGAKAFVFDQKVFVGAESWVNHDRLGQEVYQTIQRTEPGKEIHISFDPDLFVRLGDIDHYLNGSYYPFGEDNQ